MSLLFLVSLLLFVDSALVPLFLVFDHEHEGPPLEEVGTREGDEKKENQYGYCDHVYQDRLVLAVCGCQQHFYDEKTTMVDYPFSSVFFSFRENKTIQY